MRRDPQSLPDDVRESLDQARVGPDDLLIVGLSGGVDSLSLTHALAGVRDAGRGPALLAVHVDHGLRPGSSDDARTVARLAHALDVPLAIERVDVAQWSGRGHGIEAAARAARYSVLARIARDNGAACVALGHTLDDQIENALFRLARGTSLDGLAGMRTISTRSIALAPSGSPSVRTRLLRPLLHRRRSEIEAYAAQHRLTPVEDESNVDVRFRRNAIRHRVLPQLEQIVPGASDSIARALGRLADDADLLAALADEAYRRTSETVGPCIALNRDELRGLPVSIQRRLIANAVFTLVPEVDLTGERIEAVRAASLHGRVATSIEIGGSLVAYVDYERLIIGPAGDIQSCLRDHANRPTLPRGEVVSIAGNQLIDLGNQWELDISSDRPLECWELRTRRAGDRVALGSTQHQRLQDWFVDHKVPGYLRDHVPLMVHRGRIRWILGFSTPDFEDVDSGMTARLRERSMEAHGGGGHDSGHSTA